MNEKQTIDNDGFGDDEKRIADILVSGKKIEELPDVSLETLEIYHQYLSKNLSMNFLLTGQDSFGFFSWEEKFDWGYGSQKEHDKLRKKRASYHDQFVFLGLENIDLDFGIIAQTTRITDNKKFKIPLTDLKACNENTNERALLEDYSMWFVNYR